MSRPGQRSAVARPEIALKKAQNLMKVEKEQEALHTLYESLISRRQRTSADQMENVVMKFIDLCISNTKAKMAKEALMQYRNQCQQQQNVKSLEKVIKYYLEKAEKKADKAQKDLDTKVASVMEDLEDEGSPEELMLSYVSKDNQENRTQRETVMPWFRFLWDSYRNMLDILRNNSKLEEVYAIVIHKAMTFCLNYQRKQEFRRLCETLRNHLQQLRKQTGQSGLRDRSDLRIPTTFNLYVDTRLQQLSVACSLESWDEAYRSAQDLQELLYLVPKFRQQNWASQWAQYYAKLTLVFAASTAEISKLYLAYSWIQLYQTVLKRIKGLPREDFQIMANCVILSVLAVPPYVAITHVRDALDEQQQKQEDQRMEQLALVLGINIDLKLHSLKDVVSRQKLLDNIRILNILQQASPEVREMYMLLEGQCNPIELCMKFQPLLESLQMNGKKEEKEGGEDGEKEKKEEGGENGKIVENTGEVKLSAKNPIGQVRYGLYTSQLQKIAVLRVLRQLSGIYSVMTIPRLTEIIPFYGFDKLERVIVEASKYRFLQVKIDHQGNTISFEMEGFSSEPVNNQLNTLARKLDKLMPLVSKDLKDKKKEEIEQAAEQAKDRTEKEHERTLTRKLAIEKRKEQAEKEILEKQRKEEEQMEALHKQQEEKRRIMMEQDEARRKAERELREKQQEDIKMLEGVIGKEKVAAKVAASPSQKVDRDQIIQEAQEEMIKSQEEMVKKLTRMVRQVDHLERARREKQRSLVQEAATQYAEEDQQYYAKELERQKEVHKAAWERDVKEKQRVARIGEDGLKFGKSLRSRRAEQFAILRKQQEAKIAKIRAERRQVRLKQRRMEYVKRCRVNIDEKIKEMEEEEQQRKEAEKRREAEEKRAKLEEIARKQKEKEEEIEKRRQQERDQFNREVSQGGEWQEVKKSANAYVPKSLRKQQEAAAAKDAPPAASEDKWTRGGPPAAAAANGPSGAYRAPAARGEEDRWERSQTMPARGAPPSTESGWRGSRDREPAPAPRPERGGFERDSASARWDKGGDAERPRAAPRVADRPTPDRDAPPSAKEPWRPRRDREEPRREEPRREREDFRREREEPPRETAPRQPAPASQQPSGGGGGYVPPGRRGAAPPQSGPPSREPDRRGGGAEGGYVLPHMRADDRGPPPDPRDARRPDPRDSRRPDPRDRGAGSASSRW